MKNIFLFLVVIILKQNFLAQNCFLNQVSVPLSNFYGNYHEQCFDYNGDGLKDFIIASDFVCIQTPSNTFTIAPFSYTNTQVFRDMNNDGLVDLMTSNSILFNLGSGSYSLVPMNKFSGVIGDYNNDGFKDMITTVLGGEEVNLGNGTGLFVTTFSMSVPSNAVRRSALDYNNDGNLDFSYWTNNDSVLTIRSGLGNGTFGSPVTSTVGSSNGNGSFGKVDINQDGRPDFVTVKGSGAALVIKTFTTNTSNSITLVNSFTTSVSVAFPQLFVTDFNQDTYMDILIGDLGTSVKVFYGNNTGSYSSPSMITIPNFKYFSVGDLNADGFPDLALISNLYNGSSMHTATMNVFYSSSPVNLIPLTFTFNTAGALVQPPFFVDINNDNRLDMALTSYSSVPSVGAQFNVFYNNPNCVWPGDANADGFANNIDILELGLQYNQTGAARTTTSNIWNGYNYSSWTGSVSTGKNLANADCNGDGVVNSSDTLAVFNNYGYLRNAKGAISAAQLTIVPDANLVLKGTWSSASIFLGDNVTPISNINGVAFEINFDNNLIEQDSIYIDYISSFINSANQNLNFRKRVFNDGQLFCATTHTLSSNATGFGKIAILHYKIKSTLISDSICSLSLSGTFKSDASGAISQLSSGSGTFLATTAIVSILNENTSMTGVNLYPNPSSGIINISQKPFNGEYFIVVSSIDGREVFRKKLTSEFESFELCVSPGVYMYTLTNKPTNKQKFGKIVITNN